MSHHPTKVGATNYSTRSLGGRHGVATSREPYDVAKYHLRLPFGRALVLEKIEAFLRLQVGTPSSINWTNNERTRHTLLGTGCNVMYLTLRERTGEKLKSNGFDQDQAKFFQGVCLCRRRERDT